MAHIKVDYSLNYPPFQQIHDQLVAAILSGELNNGDVLPASRAMAGALGVNFHTINRTYQTMREEGFIEFTKRRRYVVSFDKKSNLFIAEFEKKESQIIDEAIGKGLNEGQIVNILRALLKKKFSSNGDG